MHGTNFLVLLGLAFYLVASFVLWQLLLKEPAPSAASESTRARLTEAERRRAAS